MIVKRKILLLGDGAVGKTSLVRRFVMDQFEDIYLKTLGTKVMKRNVVCDGVELSLIIWDILGQHGFAPIQEHHVRGSKGAILVTDLTRKDTLKSLIEYWIPLIKRVNGNIPFVFLANKSDLEDQWEFDKTELAKIAKNHDAANLVTSAKTGFNVEKAFQAMGLTMILADDENS